MAPKSRGTSLLFDSIFKSSSKQHICGSCRKNLLRTRYASTAAAQATIEPPPISQISPDEPGAFPETQPRIVVKAGIVLSRPPLTTPDPHPFETAFYLYQRRLNERLALPFTQYFHYKRGTPAFEHWRAKRRERGGVAARDIGKYNAYSKENWNDEVLVGDDSANPQKLAESLIDEEGRGVEFVAEGASEAEVRLAGMKRTTDADRLQDQTSLDRSLSRTLYLLVREKTQPRGEDAAIAWRFPSGDVEDKEGLKEAAQRVLEASCGPNMNTWFVASHPVGHSIDEPGATTEAESNQPQSSETNTVSEKTFFMKARIFAGQADLKTNSYELAEFKWLAKEEIEKHVTPDYWSSIKNMLAEQ